MENVISYCKQRNKQLLLGCDANAHHIIWGSSNTNPRGESLIEFINGEGLNVLNKGSEPTFMNCLRSEVLDLTLATDFISSRITNWHVSKEPSCSDHRHIEFQLESAKTHRIEYRNPLLTDWQGYLKTLKNEIEEKGVNIKERQQIDLAVESLQDAILYAYQRNCPLKVKRDNRKVSWWNKKLELKRKEVRKLFNKAKELGNWTEYRKILTEYNKDIRRAKRESWRKFCEGVNNTPEAARIHKILSKKPGNDVSMLKCSDGTFTTTPREVLELLIQTHFPGAKEKKEPQSVNYESMAQSSKPNRADWARVREIVTYEKVRWAINSFAKLKSPGMDQITPILLQKGEEVIIPRLVNIYRACLAWRYVPHSWNRVKIVYIPKLGKLQDGNPNNLRPLSLTSFLLKTMEKILDREIRGGILIDNPLHPKQHAYQAGKSTDSALDWLVKTIEISLERKEIAVGIFLDIEGAFNNTTLESIEKSTSSRGLDPLICNWLTAMLKGREIHTSMCNEEIIANTTRGCPQGGVLSPLLWALVADELLKALESAGFTNIQGYADDLVIVIKGSDEGTISSLIQQALNVVKQWCDKEGLCVNPSKTTIVPFTNRLKTERLREPSLNGMRISFEKEVKYLGVILDKRLTWNQHLIRMKDRVRISMWNTNRLCGSTWGLKPSMTLYLYTAIVRPMITYACHVWWPKVRQRKARTDLQSLQRQACVKTTRAMRSTPTSALEVLLKLPPLDIYIESVARNTTYRLMKISNYEVNKWFMKGHCELRKEMGKNVLVEMPSDMMTPHFNFKKPFKIRIPTREDWETRSSQLVNGDIIWYTDGSKTPDGVGSGVYSRHPTTEISMSLGKIPTVFQAEVTAIEICVRECLDKKYEHKNILILSDSQAGIKALESNRINSKLVWSCLQSLITLSQSNKVTLMWVPGHMGIKGNEKADEMARKGSAIDFIGPGPACMVPMCTIKLMNQELMMNQMNDRWRVNPHKNKFITNYSKERSEELLKMNSNQIRIIVGLLTGHCKLNKHLKTMRLTQDSLCRFCRREAETSEHILCDCEVLERRRMIYIGQGRPRMGDYWTRSLTQILELIRAIGLYAIL